MATSLIQTLSDFGGAIENRRSARFCNGSGQACRGRRQIGTDKWNGLLEWLFRCCQVQRSLEGDQGLGELLLPLEEDLPMLHFSALRSASSTRARSAGRPEARQLDDRGRPELDQGPERHPLEVQPGRCSNRGEVVRARRLSQLQHPRSDPGVRRTACQNPSNRVGSVHLLAEALDDLTEFGSVLRNHPAGLLQPRRLRLTRFPLLVRVGHGPIVRIRTERALS